MANFSVKPNLTFLELVSICDNFTVPGAAISPSPNDRSDDTLVSWSLSSSLTSPVVGLIRPAVLSQLRSENERCRSMGLPEVWDFDGLQSHASRMSFRPEIDTPLKRTAVMTEMCQRWRDTGLFEDVIGPRKWRDEMYPVYANPFGPHDTDQDGLGNYVFEMERAACALFGVVTYGVHMTIYEDGENLRIWVPTRAKTKQTWPGYLDNSVAGGIPSGMEVFESLVKESMEEASIAEDVIRKHAKAVGAVSYFFQTAKGWLQPEVEYVYDLRIPPAVDPVRFQPKPLDGEVECFELLPLEEVISHMRAGRFKPNCAVVLIDFFIRHGYMTPDNEPDFMEIVTRLHGRFNYELW